ncbi:MAG: alpha-glucosidase C-terminal domain-containing protein [Candidatus Omnitrophica bacterium]|nr:alpha-glucosidase C-terminal domain-containing protein [Candidatus Omnitrophota bacterium]
MNIRGKSNALKYGSIENVWESGDNTYAYLREYEDEKVIVVMNFLNREAISYLDLSFFPKGTVLYDELNNERFTVSNSSNFKISIPKHGSRILTEK